MTGSISYYLPVFKVENAKNRIAPFVGMPDNVNASVAPTESITNPSTGWLYKAPKAYGTYRRWWWELSNEKKNQIWVFTKTITMLLLNARTEYVCKETCFDERDDGKSIDNHPK